MANPPQTFALLDTFKHRRPEYVRQMCRANGFTQRSTSESSGKDIWIRECITGGFWGVRLDAQGHDTHHFHGGRPHYHKDWIPSQAKLDSYIQGPTRGIFGYADDGYLLGEMHIDQWAKYAHIPR